MLIDHEPYQGGGAMRSTSCIVTCNGRLAYQQLSIDGADCRISVGDVSY